jgi:PAS domain S-box-containing protein
LDESSKYLDTLTVRTVREYAIFRMDPEGIITSWNEGVERVLGYSEAEWLGKHASIIFTPEAREQGVPEQEMSEAIATGQAMDDRWHQRKDGTRLWINGVMTALLNKDGKLLGFAKIMRDNTKLKQAQAALQESNHQLEYRVRQRTAELQARNQELEDFKRSVSHDLRAPLRGIDGFSHALEEDYGEVLDETGQEYLRRIRTGAGRLAELMDNLLVLAEISRTRVRHERVDLSRLAENVVKALRTSDPERRVEVRVREGVIAEGDEGLLALALTKLLDNAWKFTEGRDNPRIEFGITSADGQEVYFVRDNGVGFDMKYGDKLFVAFQRLHSPSEFDGTGIGLAIVQRIVHAHGGKVWAESEERKGATFYFTVPREAVEKTR